MFEFAWWYLAFILPLPLLWLLFNKKYVQTASLKVPFFQTLEQSKLLSKSSLSLNWAYFLLWLAWLFLILSTMRPVWIDEGIKLPIQGRDILLAVDLSGSMREEDFTLNNNRASRLAVVKAAAKQFIEKRKQDRLGLIVFGSQAFLYAPLTFDKNLLLAYLSDAQINMAGQRTAIGDAIVLAIKHFIDNEKQSDEVRTLILLTDGENTAGSITPEKATELAAEEHIKIYTIAMGANKNNFFNRGVDEASLKRIAKVSGGQYFHANDSKRLYQIYQAIDRLEQKELEEKIYRPRKDLFYYPLSAFLLLLTLLLLRRLW